MHLSYAAQSSLEQKQLVLGIICSLILQPLRPNPMPSVLPSPCKHSLACVVWGAWMSRLLSQAAAEAEIALCTLKTALPPCQISSSKACDMGLLCATQSNAAPLHQDRAFCREVRPLPLRSHPSPQKWPLVPPSSAWLHNTDCTARTMLASQDCTTARPDAYRSTVMMTLLLRKALLCGLSLRTHTYLGDSPSALVRRQHPDS